MIYLFKVLIEYALEYPKSAKLIDITTVLVLAIIVLFTILWLYDNNDTPKPL